MKPINDLIWNPEDEMAPASEQMALKCAPTVQAKEKKQGAAGTAGGRSRFFCTKSE
ncbi:hypothetical protein [Faecalimonas sp.]